jgi:hypothetical protein
MKRFIVAVFVLSGATAAWLRAADADAGRWWSFVEALANDGMEGRDTGSAAHRRAAEYVSSQFALAGLSPAPGASGYLQPVKFIGWKIVEAQSRLELIRNGKAEPLTLGEDAYINLRIDPAASVEAPLVFVGYGLTVPEMNVNDLAGLDLKGKIVVALGGGPSTISGPLRAHYGYATERGRFREQAGAVGYLTIFNPRTSDLPWARSASARLQEAMSLADPNLVDYRAMKIGATINAEHANKWLAGSGHTIKELLDLVSAGKPLPRFPLVPSLRASTVVERRDIDSQNVVAVRPGTDPALRNEYVVMSAHLDHVGVGEPIDGDRIYNGAMDDASGVAAMLEIANRLKEGGRTTRRSLMFVAVTGEEKRAARVALLRGAPAGGAQEHGRRPEYGHVPAALPAAGADGLRRERIGSRRCGTTGRPLDDHRGAGGPGAGAERLHAQRSVQLHSARNSGGDGRHRQPQGVTRSGDRESVAREAVPRPVRRPPAADRSRRRRQLYRGDAAARRAGGEQPGAAGMEGEQLLQAVSTVSWRARARWNFSSSAFAFSTVSS